MKIIKESKEKLPIDFITQFISKGWEEVGNLKASIEGINNGFNETKKVEEILQNFLDSYLIAIGQMEAQLEKKDYLDLPKEEELKEALTESNEAEAQPIEAKKFEDENKTEIFTELPDYDVEVEQKGDKIEIELEPKEKVGKYIGSGEMVGGDFGNDEWPEPVQDGSAVEDAKAALANGELKIGEPEIQVVNNQIEDEVRDEMSVPEFVKDEGHSEEPVEVDNYFVEFPEIEPDEEKDLEIKKLLEK